MELNKTTERLLW